MGKMLRKTVRRSVERRELSGLSEDPACLHVSSSGFMRPVRLGRRDDLARPRLLRINHHIRIHNRRRHHCFRTARRLGLFVDSRINLGRRGRWLQLRSWGGWRLNRCFLPRGRVRRQCDSRPCAQEKKHGAGKGHRERRASCHPSDETGPAIQEKIGRRIYSPL